MKKFLVILFVLIVSAGGFAWFQFKSILHYRSPEKVTVVIEKGSSIKKISRVLADHRVVANAKFFEYASRLEGEAGRFKAGEYEFEAGMTAEQVMDKLVEGKVLLYSVTIPEGNNLNDIGKLLVSKNIASETEWRNLLNDAEWIKTLNIPAASLEGYLFPDTYLYEKRASLKEIVKSMVDLFFKKADAKLTEDAKQKGLSLHQWVTLASIIEKETGQASERPLIAAVFLNRLKINMPLQTDPTVIYGVPNFNGNLTRADLERDSLYNTYTRQGLPPGPICSPGLEALKSVLKPAQSEALYFVAKGDGSHYFSKTLDQHNQAVNYYQRKFGSPPP